MPRHPVADHVVPARLLGLIEALARYGALPQGGVDRQALTATETEARRFLVGHARALGATAFQDSAGNLFFRREGVDTGAPVVTGSHIDTQPAGGRLDGAFGVCAGLELLAALHEMRVRTRRAIEVVVWSNEEGCRFAPGSTGSAAFVDPSRLAGFRAALDAGGASYGECVDRMQRALGEVPMRELAFGIHTFIEAHIEQGPVLEQAGVPIGAVTGIQGVRWFRVRATGQAAHAGTTPLEFRHDAFRALTDLAGRAYALAERTAGLRLTIGTVGVVPGSVNTIPGEATLTLDVRHPGSEALDACEGLLADFCAQSRHGCEVSYVRTMALPATGFDTGVQASIRAAAGSHGFAALDVVSGAFHDALHLARHCPTGMLFVPSRGGLSHNPEEHTDDGELVAGARVLAAVVAQYAEVLPGGTTETCP